MNNRTEFFTLVPIYNLLPPATPFQCSGTLDDCEFNIELVNISQSGIDNTKRLEDLFSQGGDFDKIYNKTFDFNINRLFKAQSGKCMFVLIKYVKEKLNYWSSYQQEIAKVFLNSLDLVTIYGIRHDVLYTHIPIHYERSGTGLAFAEMSHLHKLLPYVPFLPNIHTTNLELNDFDALKNVFNNSLDLFGLDQEIGSMPQLSTSQFAKIVRLVYDLYFSSRCIAPQRMSFFILASAIDAMFKKDNTVKLKPALEKSVKYINKSTSIVSSFDIDETYNIRNAIAHGDVLDARLEGLLPNLLPDLFFHVKDCLKNLILNRNNFDQAGKDYFDLMQNYVDTP